MATGDLTRERRERERDLLASGHPVDVLVIGGGITGAGVALDAATRGLSVALVEREDLAFGTSRWSSKLAHGGLRYLAHGDVGVAWESAVERRHLMSAIAPHLVRPLPHVMPAFDDTRRSDSMLVRAGLSAADVLRTAARTPRGTLGRPRTLRAGEVIELVPAVDASRLRGGSLHWDGQLVDDARLVVAVARTAARYGAHILTHAAAREVGGHGARVADATDGATYDITARCVIIATGVWTEELDPGTAITVSRGSHALIDPAALGHPRAALTVQVPDERGRYVFALPTVDGPVIAGITDVAVDGPIEGVPVAPSDEIDWILRQLSTALARELTGDDVVGTYAGLRPLVAPAAGTSSATADISRRHLVARNADGCVVVTGGKLTTYRRMAQDALDLAAVPGAGRCVTATTPLIGAQPYRASVPDGVPVRLVRRYGSEASRVVAHAYDEPSLMSPIAPGVPALGVEVVHAILAEGAATIDDIAQRRLRLDLIASQQPAARDRVAEIAAGIAPGIHA